MKPTLKPLLAILAAALFMASAIPASALSALIKQGQAGQTGTPAPIILVDAATGQIGQAGLASTATVTVEKPGTFAYVAATGTFVDGTGGSYKYFPSAAETASAGILLVRVTAPDAVQADVAVQVVGFDPASATVSLATTDYNAIAAAVLAQVIDGTITLKQAQALQLAYSFNPYTRTKTATTQSLIYQNRAGLPIATAVSGLDALGNITGRNSVTFNTSNLPQ